MLALIPLLVSLVPEIARLIGGDTAGDVAQRVATVATTVLGTSDPAAVTAALADPAKLSDLRIALAKIEADQAKAASDAQTAQLVARLGDVADARRQTVALAGAHSSVQWGAPVVSAIVLLTFGGVMLMALTRALPAGSEAIANVMLGSLSAMATAVVTYWVGSSSGSEAKTNMIYRSTPVTEGGTVTRPLAQ